MEAAIVTISKRSVQNLKFWASICAENEFIECLCYIILDSIELFSLAAIERAILWPKLEILHTVTTNLVFSLKIHSLITFTSN
jgi:hypothetical protein